MIQRSPAQSNAVLARTAGSGPGAGRLVRNDPVARSTTTIGAQRPRPQSRTPSASQRRRKSASGRAVSAGTPDCAAASASSAVENKLPIFTISIACRWAQWRDRVSRQCRFSRRPDTGWIHKVAMGEWMAEDQQIIVVDDDPSVRDAIRAYLGDHDFEV